MLTEATKAEETQSPEQVPASRLDEIMHFLKRDVLIGRLEVDRGEIDNDEGLFDPQGLGLDSIEALEIMVAVEGTYHVSFQGMPEEQVRQSFYSVRSLATLINKMLDVTQSEATATATATATT